AKLLITGDGDIGRIEMDLEGLPMEKENEVFETEFKGEMGNTEVEQGLRLRAEKGTWTLTTQQDFSSGTLENLTADDVPGELRLKKSGEAIGIYSFNKIFEGAYMVDDFNEFNTSIWQLGNNATVTIEDYGADGKALKLKSTSTIHGDNEGNIRSIMQFDNRTVIEVRARMGEKYQAHGIGFVYLRNTRYLFWYLGADQIRYLHGKGTDDVMYLNSDGAYNLDNHTYRISWVSNYVSYYHDFSLRNTLPIPTAYMQNAVIESIGGTVYIDNVRVYPSEYFYPVRIKLVDNLSIPFVGYTVEAYDLIGTKIGSNITTNDGTAYIELLSNHSFPIGAVFRIFSPFGEKVGEDITIQESLNAVYPNDTYLAVLSRGYSFVGSFISKVFNANKIVNWREISWDSTLHPNTNIEIRTNSSTDGITWSGFSTPYTNKAGSNITSPSGKFILCKVRFLTTDPKVTPALEEIRITYASYVPNGYYKSIPIELSNPIASATLYWNRTLPMGTTVLGYLSNDNGSTWFLATRGIQLEFPYKNNILRYKLELSSNHTESTPLIDYIKLNYTTATYPLNPTLDILDDGNIDWNYTGIFNFTTTLDITEVAVMHIGENIPLNFTSSSPGKIKISNLSAKEDTGFKIISYSPFEKSINISEGESVFFRVNISDPDGDAIITWYMDSYEVGKGQIYTFASNYSSQGKHNVSASIVDSVHSDKVDWILDIKNVNRVPIALISSPEKGKTYSTNEDILFDGTKSSDDDGDKLTYEWLINEKSVSKEPKFYKKLSEGINNITLIVSDGIDSNKMEITITVYEAKVKIGDVKIDAQPEKEGELTIKIENPSSVPVRNVNISIYIDGVLKENKTLNFIGANKSESVKFSLPPLSKGEHKIKIEANGAWTERVFNVGIFKGKEFTVDEYNWLAPIIVISIICAFVIIDFILKKRKE
ncbi:MAG: hypothetical protein AB1779_03685, partial [Candidatus Thermoplasmatota archaeon]